MKRLNRIFASAVLAVFLSASLAGGATITKGLIGEQDQNKWDGVTGTFTRPSSTGGTLTLNKIGHEVDALMSYGGGVNFTRGTIASALAAIGTTNKVALVLRPGTWVIDSDLTITSNITLKVPAGAVLSISTTKTLTINGPFEAGLYQVFSCAGSGAVSFGYKSAIEYEWFANLQKAINSLSVGGTVYFTYNFTQATQVVLPALNIGLEARANLGTITSTLDDGTPLFSWSDSTATPNSQQYVFRNLHLYGVGYSAGATGSHAFSFDSGTAQAGEKVLMDNVRIEGFRGTGIYLSHMYNGTFRSVLIYNCNRGVHLHDSSNANIFYNLQIQGTHNYAFYVDSDNASYPCYAIAVFGGYIQNNHGGGIYLSGRAEFYNVHMEGNHSDGGTFYSIYLASNLAAQVTGVGTFVNVSNTDTIATHQKGVTGYTTTSTWINSSHGTGFAIEDDLLDYVNVIAGSPKTVTGGWGTKVLSSPSQGYMMLKKTPDGGGASHDYWGPIIEDPGISTFYVNPDENTNTITNPTTHDVGRKITFVVTQDATGGRSIAFGTSFTHAWSNTGNTANKISTITFVCTGSGAGKWIQVGAQSPYM